MTSEAIGGATMDLGELITNLTEGVGGVYDMAAQGFDFVIGNPLGIMMVCISFAGAGIGLVGRAFKTARK